MVNNLMFWSIFILVNLWLLAGFMGWVRWSTSPQVQRIGAAIILILESVFVLLALLKQ